MEYKDRILGWINKVDDLMSYFISKGETDSYHFVLCPGGRLHTYPSESYFGNLDKDDLNRIKSIIQEGSELIDLGIRDHPHDFENFLEDIRNAAKFLGFDFNPEERIIIEKDSRYESLPTEEDAQRAVEHWQKKLRGE